MHGLITFLISEQKGNGVLGCIGTKSVLGMFYLFLLHCKTGFE